LRRRLCVWVALAWSSALVVWCTFLTSTVPHLRLLGLCVHLCALCALSCAVEGDIWTLSNLRPAPGSAHRKKRKGRGDAAGQGASCGFGMRGQKSRSGRPTRAGFEGGQTPLYRRLPKFVGRPMGPGHTKKEYALIKLSTLNSAADNTEVDADTLRAAGALTKSCHKYSKVVGGEDLTAKGLTVKAHAFTQSAREAIEGSGGNCVVVPKTAPAVKEPVAA